MYLPFVFAIHIEYLKSRINVFFKVNLILPPPNK